MSNQRTNTWTPFLFAAALAVGLFLGYQLQGTSPLLVKGSSNSASNTGRVEELLKYIEARYVDGADQDKLAETAIRAILDELDPHSSYIAARDLAALTESMEGNFDGIGIEFLVVDDTITVVSAMIGGPSAKAGLEAGDQIIMVEDSVVTGVTKFNIDPASLMKGVSGTTVNITIRRPGVDEKMPFALERAPIPVYSVDAAYKLDENTAYVKINRFSATTYDEFVMALEAQLEKKGGHSVVIDLRDNPGGYLQQATKMLSQLFPQKGELLVYTEGRNSRRVEYKTNGRALYNIINVAVLIDEGSASASEIVAGAIQDHDRGIVVGRRSFGKGLVQEQYDLSDESALRLTVARYYTPSGRSIQRSYEEGEDDYRSDINRRYETGELFSGDDVGRDSSLLYYTDSGHPVFGGGGITPDYFVPLDTSLNNETFLRLRQEIPAYLFGYVRRHPQVKQFADFADFQSNYRLNLDEILPDLTNRALEDVTDGLEDLPFRLRADLTQFFRARLARQLFGNSAYFEIINEDDPIVTEALRLLSGSNPLVEARQD
jgi:carboxyl-terminal processing protease